MTKTQHETTLSPEYREWVARTNALHAAGIYPNQAVNPVKIGFELKSGTPQSILAEITKPAKTDNIVASTIVNQKLGAVVIDESKPDVLFLITPSPEACEKAIQRLKTTRQIGDLVYAIA